MAIDRTLELLECFECRGARKAASPARRKDEGLRNRHRKERFAVEDHLSPSLRGEDSVVLSDSDMDDSGVATPPGTFLSEAHSILSDVLEAERLFSAAVKTMTSGGMGSDFQQVIDLCLMRVAALQKLSDRLAEERRSGSRGWLAGFLTEDPVAQLDQHEAAIVWFLSHRLSLLTKQVEGRREEAERREKEASRLRLLRKHALASARPELSPNAEGLVAPVDALSTPADRFAEKYGVSQDQMVLLAEENESLVREYQGMREQITTTQASLNEISRLQSTLQEQLVYQAAQIDRLFDDAIGTVDTVKRANTQLGKAARGQSTSVKLFLWFIILATLFILTIHIVSD